MQRADSSPSSRHWLLLVHALQVLSTAHRVQHASTSLINEPFLAQAQVPSDRRLFEQQSLASVHDAFVARQMTLTPSPPLQLSSSQHCTAPPRAPAPAFGHDPSFATTQSTPGVQQ